jgi:hypothetical protein
MRASRERPARIGCYVAHDSAHRVLDSWIGRDIELACWGYDASSRATYASRITDDRPIDLAADRAA